MNKLKELRFKTGITQWELFKETGIHQSKISLFENEIINPRLDEKTRIAKVLGVEPSMIWADDFVR